MEADSVIATQTPKQKKGYLQADPKVPGQDWCVLTFISPEDRVTQKTLFTGDKFLTDVINEYITASAIHMARDINAELEKKFEAQIAKLTKSKVENHRVIANEMAEIRSKIQINEEQFAKACEHTHKMEQEDFLAKFDDYKIKRGDELEREFVKKYGPGTSTRGIKFSGAYPYQDMAIERAEFLAEQEKGVHHFVATSFEWLPFDPNPDAIKDNRFSNKELNELMKRKQESEALKDKHFVERKQGMVNKANTDTKNIKKDMKKKYAERLKAKAAEIQAQSKVNSTQSQPQSTETPQATQSSNPSTESPKSQ